MSVVEASVEVAAPPEVVWKVVSDPRNLPRWDRHITAVEGVPPSGLGQGTEYTTELRFMGARAHVDARVLELEPPGYAKVSLSGLIDGTVETWLESLDRGRTRLRHRVTYRFRGGPLGRLAARATQVLGAPMILRRGAMAQKEQAEAAA